MASPPLITLSECIAINGAAQHPYLGASPDGKEYCDCCGSGCLEIECPYLGKDKDFCLVGSSSSDVDLNRQQH
ncbi:hypothetical protein DPX16_2167 [Anabarilius grahami]|uniref:Uncharacterized protein n=1 Tax=Anabarilius grahami TaxID=495550 RepID=A0A3N0YF77_ANAGA|nr:hypothetical protein DPX16_2167 [Anabarilius grahami]